jgi:hypothetical protein
MLIFADCVNAYHISRGSDIGAKETSATAAVGLRGQLQALLSLRNKRHFACPRRFGAVRYFGSAASTGSRCDPNHDQHWRNDALAVSGVLAETAASIARSQHSFASQRAISTRRCS